MSSISTDFVFLVLRATLFTFLQASISAAISSFVGTLLGVLGFFSESPKKGLGFWSAVFRFMFSVPGVVMAFSVLLFVKSSGWAAIVLCHFVFSVGWVWVETREKMNQELLGSALDELQLASVFGARLRQQFLRGPLFSLWSRAFVEKFWILFFVFMNSFSVVLILGGGPQYSTLEVLNYYSLLQGENYERVLLIGLSQFVVALVGAYVLARYLKAQKITQHTQQNVRSKLLWVENLGLKSNWVQAIKRVFLLLMSLILGGIIYGVLRDIARVEWVPEIGLAAQNTLLLVFLSAGVYGVLSWILLLSAFERLLNWKYLFMAISPTWLSTGAFYLLGKFPMNEFLAVAVVLNLGWLPWMIYIFQTSWEKIPKSQIELAACFGAKNIEVKKKFFRTYMRGSWLGLLVFVILASGADLFVSQLFFESHETLVMMSRRWAQRYQFEGMSLVVGLQSLIALVLISGKEYYESRV